jgi:hypothetical protein
MFGFFSRRKSELTGAQAAARGKQDAGRGGSDSRTGTQQHTDIQRELVRVVLKDVLHAHGIPGTWLGCEVWVPSKRSSDDDLTVQLHVLHWNELLLRYAPALERALLKALDRFDPLVDHSRYRLSWHFSPKCGCPYTELPDKRMWAQPGAAAAPVAGAAPAPAAILDRRQRPRDQNPPGGRPREGPSTQAGDGFARTQMTPLP